MSECDPILGVDVGGTFTDVVLVAGGRVTTAKVPTTTDQSEGVLEGIEIACERADIDPETVDRFRHGTTVTTNAMLEGGFHHLPVVDDDDAIIGIVTTTDLAAYISTVQTPSPS